MTYKTRPSHLRNRDGIYHFIRRIPADLRSHYRSDRICLSLRTKSAAIACRAADSISQRLDDYWSGLRLQKMDVPALHLLISNDDNKYDSPTLKEAVDAYLLLKGGVTNPVFAMTIAGPIGFRPQRKANFSTKTVPIDIHDCNFLNSSRASHILTQATHLPVAGRIAR